jgi:hypothetical protein
MEVSRVTGIRIGERVYDDKHSPPPQDKMFREAWAVNGSVPPQIVVDMEKAKDIAREMIREARKPFFEKYDAEFNVAAEDGSDVSIVAEKRKRLRAATDDTRITKAETPNQLKAAIAEIVAEF